MAPPQRSDRLERMTNLVLVLLETTQPLTLQEIRHSVAGYPDGHEASRQAFERDKRALRDLGIPLSVEHVDSEQQLGYRIRPEDYYLPDLGLSADEEQALAFAVAAVQLGGAAGSEAIAKIGSPIGESMLSRAGLAGPAPGPGVPPVAVLPSLPELGAIHEALRARSVLAFRYRGRDRNVEPYGLAFRNAAWYLVGRDLSAEGGPALRTFRVERFESPPEEGEAGSYELPVGFDLRSEIRLLPWSTADEASELPVADVRVDARMARVVATQVPETAIAGTDEDGSIRVRLTVGDTEAFFSWALGLGDTALVTGPPELRRAVVDRLRASAEESSDAEPPPKATKRGRRAPVAPTPAEAPAPTRPAAGAMASARLRRLLAILAYLARVKEASLPELAERFAISEDELVHDLELAACCGVPPYTPDELIDLLVDGDRVTAEGLSHLSRPGRLTPEEGFVVAAAARALLSVPGADAEGALASGLGKLEAALGSSPLSVELDPPAQLNELQEAARSSAQVEIEYFSSAAPAPTRRFVDPYQVVLREGRWYLDGWCHRAAGLRRFQVDRVRTVRRTGASFAPPSELSEELNRPGAFLGGPDAVAARVVFPPGAALVAEQVAAGPIETRPDGSLVADVLVGDAEGWFGRLLLRLGPAARVLSPPELRDAARRAAERALEQYGEGR
jgi:proteasome accessory factor C